MVKIILDSRSKDKRSTYLTVEGKGYYVDSTKLWMSDRANQYETMVFNWKPKKGEEVAAGGGDIEWDGLYTENHNSVENMFYRHENLIKNFEEIVEEIS